jgi:hypothetical protein
MCTLNLDDYIAELSALADQRDPLSSAQPGASRDVPEVHPLGRAGAGGFILEKDS